MITTTNVENESGKAEVLYLAPVVVAIENQNQKVGSELIRSAMKKAHDLGFKAVFLAGNPAYLNKYTH